jgi:hypothetical protein
MQRLLTPLLLVLILIGLSACGGSAEPDPAAIDAAVAATLTAWPTPAPVVVEVTRVVEVTSVAMAPTDTPAPPPAAPAVSETQTLTTTEQQPTVALPAQDSRATAAITPTVAAPTPGVAPPTAAGCPTQSTNQYTNIPMEGVDLNHPDSQHGDLNLALRGYAPSNAARELVALGAVDPNAPQIRGIFADKRQPGFLQVYQVHDWDWGCQQHGCAKSDLVGSAEVSALGVATVAGEAIRVATRNPEIYGGGYVAAVLYAEPSRLTIAYTRDGTVAGGYSLHLENLCVDPNLVAAYQAANAAGRGQLPGLQKESVVGTATGGEMVIAIRDRGAFLDPRSRDDWWR